MAVHDGHAPLVYPKFYHQHGPAAHLPTHNMPMRHAFVVVGTETIFLCHQIMGFMEGHNYELVLEVTLPDAVRKALIEDREKNGTTWFLANQVNNEFTLPQVRTGKVTTMTADLWNFFPKQWGHQWPWGNTRPSFADVKVAIRRVVHYRHIDLNVSGHRFQSYLLFGRDSEAHVNHQVVYQPEYDHVASLEAVPDWIEPDQLEAGVIISVPDLPWRRESTYCRNPLPPGRHRVLYFGIEAYRDQHGQDPALRIEVPPYHVQVARTWWFSTRVVNFFPEDPCSLIEIPEPV